MRKNLVLKLNQCPFFVYFRNNQSTNKQQTFITIGHQCLDTKNHKNPYISINPLCGCHCWVSVNLQHNNTAVWENVWAKSSTQMTALVILYLLFGEILSKVERKCSDFLIKQHKLCGLISIMWANTLENSQYQLNYFYQRGYVFT